MDKIKISNKLLKFVFGVDCEFSIVNNLNSKLIFKCDENLKYHGEYVEFYNEGLYLALNLHTFIHLAKIKAFECGYELETDALEVTVYYNGCNSCERFGGLKVYDLERELKALEFVAEKVGGDS